MNRRDAVIALVALSAVPLSSFAQQQAGQMKRIGVLATIARTDREMQSRLSAFVQRLRELGWTDGNNLRIDYRFGEGDASRLPRLARELFDLEPDVVVALSTLTASAYRAQTLSTPIVFIQVPDPIAAGFATNLARPDGNVTGFTGSEFSIGGKWLQSVKECAPNTKRVLVVFDPANASWTSYWGAMEASAPKLSVQLTPARARNAVEIEHGIATFAKLSDGALVALPSPVNTVHREQIISLAARHHLPAIYPYSVFTKSGGLMSYGVDLPDLYRRAASYVDRILKGAKPADLPIQQPTKFELVINLKTAKALGIIIPQSLLARADEVIQ